MTVHRFPLFSGVGEPVAASATCELPLVVSVMCAGEQICEAHLEAGAYKCDLPDEYAAKLKSGKLDQVFVYEPPFTGEAFDDHARQELVSILLVGASRTGHIPGT